jgi:hypothetical protein
VRLAVRSRPSRPENSTSSEVTASILTLCGVAGAIGQGCQVGILTERLAKFRGALGPCDGTPWEGPVAPLAFLDDNGRARLAPARGRASLLAEERAGYDAIAADHANRGRGTRVNNVSDLNSDVDRAALDQSADLHDSPSCAASVRIVKSKGGGDARRTYCLVRTQKLIPVLPRVYEKTASEGVNRPAAAYVQEE